MWLGFLVKAYGEPAPLTALAEALRGHGTALAWALTTIGRGYVLGPLYGALLVVAIFNRTWRVPALLAVASGLACWGAADAFQHFFARPRPVDWLVHRETAFSYPSSHAAISTGFFFLLGLLALKSQLPQWARMSFFIIMTLLTLGILWSRIELAAHHITDVIGGVLLAASIMLAGSAAFTVYQGRWARVRSIR